MSRSHLIPAPLDTAGNRAISPASQHSCPLLSPIFLIGAVSLVSGRRVKGRLAIACDAAGALNALAARPYDLRHTAVSLWLNGEVAATGELPRKGLVSGETLLFPAG
jgi:hypothetical protein